MSARGTRPRGSGIAAALLRLLAFLVPRGRRRSWLESWRAELWDLERRRRGADGSSLPTPLALGLGAARHSLWLRKETVVTLFTREFPSAVRAALRRPGFAAVAVLTMALGIGANTVVFSMANALLLRTPPAIAAPERLVQIGRDRPDGSFDNLAYPYVATLEQASGFSGVGAYSGESLYVGPGTEREIVPAQLVSGGYFEVLGVEPILGRPIVSPDDRRGAEPVAVIGEGYWNRRFGRDPEILGRALRIGTAEHRIVGVVPAGFGGVDVVGPPADLWVPISSAPTALGPSYGGTGPGRFDGFGMSWLWVVGRLAGSATPSSLDAEIDELYAAAYEARWGEAPQSTLGVLPTVGLRPDERAAVAELMGVLALIVGVVLAVACGNLTNLLLARGMDRTRELAIRTALGASRPRIVLQLVTENLVLATVGGLVAFVVAVLAARLVPALLPVSTSVGFEPDATVFLFAVGAGLVCGVLVGLVPAVRSSGRGPVAAMREGEQLQGRSSGWLRQGLVTGQLALSFALLAVAGLLVRSLVAGQSADPGYSTDDVATATVSLDAAAYGAAEAGSFWERLEQRAAELPGVRGVTLASRVPFRGWSRRGVYHPDPSQIPEDRPLEPDSATVGDEFFSTLEIPLLAGRGFEPARGAEVAPEPVIVSRSLARLLWPDSDPVGELLPLSPERTPAASLRVIGVVADVQFRSLREPPRPSIYLSARQRPPVTGSLYVRTSGDPAALARPLRRLIGELEPDAAVLDVATLREAMGRSLEETRLVARLAVTFGLLAITLAAVGLYGVISYVSSSRTREVGVRMALGARPADVLALFVRKALLLVAFGLLVGTALTAAAGRVLDGLLYGVSALDPLTLVLIAAGTTLLAVGAAIVPALRAARTDPALAVRGL